jgi:hypothetical protein
MRSQIYEITFKGQADTTLRAEFDDCAVTVGSCTTTLRAELPDQAALAGLVQRITGFRLEVVHLYLVEPPTRTMTDLAQVTAQDPPAACRQGSDRSCGDASPVPRSLQGRPA